MLVDGYIRMIDSPLVQQKYLNGEGEGMRTGYYDRQGREIADVLEFGRLFEDWIRRLKVRFQVGNWWVDVQRLNERAGYRWNGQEWGR